jgi:hypothetical protein
MAWGLHPSQPARARIIRPGLWKVAPPAPVPTDLAEPRLPSYPTTANPCGLVHPHAKLRTFLVITMILVWVCRRPDNPDMPRLQHWFTIYLPTVAFYAVPYPAPGPPPAMIRDAVIKSLIVSIHRVDHIAITSHPSRACPGRCEGPAHRCPGAGHPEPGGSELRLPGSHSRRPPFISFTVLRSACGAPPPGARCRGGDRYVTTTASPALGA